MLLFSLNNVAHFYPSNTYIFVVQQIKFTHLLLHFFEKSKMFVRKVGVICNLARTFINTYQHLLTPKTYYNQYVSIIKK